MTVLTSLLSYLTNHPSPLRSPEATSHLASQSKPFLSTTQPDTPETWLLHETLLLASLATSFDGTAKEHLSHLTKRFGPDTPRVQALTGLYDEAVAPTRESLHNILTRYSDLLKADPTNSHIAKRRVTLLHHLGRHEEAIAALTKELEVSPTDAEGWSMLAELYREQGMWEQARFCLEEVLLVMPNAYSVHARMGECWMLQGGEGSESEALRWYARSVELCEWYLRGLYGIVLVTRRMLKGEKWIGGELTREEVKQLNSKASAKLQELVDRATEGQKGWTGFDAGEVEAARELLEEEKR